MSGGFSEIFLPGEPFASATRVGPLVHGSRLAAHTENGLEAQGRAAMAKMVASVEAAGGSADTIAEVSFFFTESRPGIAALNAAWIERFPNDDDRPTYKFMGAPLPPGQLVAIDYFAVIGERRKLLHLPKVAHTNPIPMGVRIGNFLFSSRVLPQNPDDGTPGKTPAEQADYAFHNASELLRVGGMAWRDVVQCRAFIADPSSRPLIEHHWRSVNGRGVLHVSPYAGPPGLMAFVEIFARTG
jgi:2-iminobutanoate/2-iminopropanoate deaminase